MKKQYKRCYAKLMPRGIPTFTISKFDTGELKQSFLFILSMNSLVEIEQNAVNTDVSEVFTYTHFKI